MIISGTRFPDFQLPNQDGKTKTLTDYAGKWLVLYVYPKDDTPGCTIQGKSFTAEKAQFEKLGVNIVGLSQDDVKSHKDFCTKFSFTIDLLSDVDGILLKATDVGQTDYKGTLYWDRTTFLIDPKGQLKKVYEKVNPNGHESVLLKEIAEFQSGKRIGAITPGFNTITPYLTVSNAPEAIEFYKKALGATEIMRMEDSGKIMHAELKIGNSIFMLADEFPQMGNKSPKTLGGSSIGLMLSVEDCDLYHTKAVAAGAKELRPIQNQFYGARSGTVQDPYGYCWTFTTQIEVLTNEEMNKRAVAAKP